MRADTTPASRRDLRAILGDTRSRIVQLLMARSESCAELPVPTRAGVTVRDVLIGMAGPTESPDATMSELVASWSRSVDGVRKSATLDDVIVGWIVDAVMSEHDLRTALDLAGARDDVAVKVALDELAGRFSDRVAASGLPPLRVTVEQWGTIAGDGPASACLVTDRFEFVRAMSGRRSASEIRRWNWSGDPRPYLDVIAETVLPIDEVREPDPRVPSHLRDREFVV